MRLTKSIVTVLGMLALCTTAVAQGQRHPVPDIGETVEAGSTDHEVLLKIVNEDTKPARGVTASIASKPDGVINARIEPATVAEIAPGASATMRLLFDIDKDAKHGLLGAINLSFNAREGRLSRNGAMINLAIDGRADEPEAPVAAEPVTEPTSTPPRFRLVAIKGPRSGRKDNIVIEWAKDTPGVTTRWYRGGAWDGPRGEVKNVGPGKGEDDTKYRNVQIASASLSGIPTEIVIGQPFEFTVNATRRQEYVNGSPSCAVRSWGGFSEKVGVSFSAFGLGGSIKGNKDLRHFCDEAKRMPHPNPRYRAYQPAAKQDAVAASVRMVPTKIGKTREGYPRYFYYRMEVSGGGADTTGVRRKENNVLDFDTKDFLTDEQGFLRPGHRNFERAKRKRLRITVQPNMVMTNNTIIFEYAPVSNGEPYISSVPPYVEPPDFAKPTGTGLGGGGQDGGTQTSDADGSESGSSGNTGSDGNTGGPGGGGPGGGNNGRASSTGSTGSAGTGSGGTSGSSVAALTPGGSASSAGRGGGAGGTDGPGAIPGLPATGPDGTYTANDIRPENPTVGTFIREWIAVAEPPENADPGFRLRYNNRGTKIGTTPTGTITDNHDTGAFNPTYLWTNKKGLASLNHCSLGDFVLKRANGSASPRCTGGARPSATALPRLAGMSVGQAKAALKRLGLKAKLRPGKPAPNKKLFGKIERQSPKAGSKAKKGQTVALFVHSKPKAGTVTVPDLRRLSSREARAALKQAGLKARLRPGKPARTAALAGKVGRQSPPAGNQVKRNKVVTLFIAAPPARGVKVPDLASMSQRDAAAALRRAGLKPTIRRGPAAPERSLSAKVQGTQPPSGATAGKGSSVVITVYGKYQPTAAERRRERAEQQRRQRAEQARRDAEERARRDARERARQAAVERARRQAAESARRQAAERARREALQRQRQQLMEQVRRDAMQRAQRQRELARQRELTRQRELARQREQARQRERARQQALARQREQQRQRNRARTQPSNRSSGLTPPSRSSRAAADRARKCTGDVRRSGRQLICGCSGYTYDSRRRICVKAPSAKRPATTQRTTDKPLPPPHLHGVSCYELERQGYKCPKLPPSPGQTCIFGLC